MEPSSWTFIAFLVLIAMNRLLLARGRARPAPLLHAFVQGLNSLAILFVIGKGLPGFEEGSSVLSWIIVVLILFHVIENETIRITHRRRLAAARELEQASAETREAIMTMTSCPPEGSLSQDCDQQRSNATDS